MAGIMDDYDSASENTPRQPSDIFHAYERESAKSPKTGLVLSKLTDLDDLTDGAQNSFDGLLTRIDPVLSPENSEAGEESSDFNHNTDSELLHRLKRLEKKLEMLRKRIIETDERVEL